MSDSNGANPLLFQRIISVRLMLVRLARALAARAESLDSLGKLPNPSDVLVVR